MSTHAAVKSSKRSPNSENLAIWREYLETSEQLRTMLAVRLQAESDLSTGDYAVLLALSEADGKTLRSSELADRINWERSRLSHHLRRMEMRGVVARHRCVDDSRGAEVTLTEDGAALFRRASAPHLRAIQDLFIDGLDSDLLHQAESVSRALNAHLQRLAATTRS